MFYKMKSKTAVVAAVCAMTAMVVYAAEATDSSSSSSASSGTTTTTSSASGTSTSVGSGTTSSGSDSGSQSAGTATMASVTGGYASGTGAEAAVVPVTVYTLADLQAAVKNKKRHIIISGHIYGGSTPIALSFSTADWNGTTIEGVNQAQLENIQLKFSGQNLPTATNIQHVVIKNIAFYGRIADLQTLSGDDITIGGSGTNYLGVSFRRVTDAWVDHCTMYNISDDLTAATTDSDNITYSWNKFYFTADWMTMSPNPNWNWVGTWQPLADERIMGVFGKNWADSYLYGSNLLHMTFHHNQFGPLMRGRPLFRGYTHLYNNYFDNSVAGNSQYNALQVGSGGVLYSESNYFYKTNNTNQLGFDDATHTSYQFYEQNNMYDATTGTSVTGAAYPSTVNFGYLYQPDVTSSLPTTIPAGAGAS